MTNKIAVTYKNREKVRPYETALREVGLEPVLISSEEPRLSLQDLEGLLLTGGNDVNPARYGQPRHPETRDCDDQRDELEDRLTREALARDLPVLAICRGMQLFNVVHGGTLIQDMDRHRVRSLDPSEPVHRVRVEADSKLGAILGPGLHAVNSRHHQAIDQVGEGLVVTARSEDGVIEGLERPDRRFAIAVQWHPEDCLSRNPEQRKLFEAFREAVLNQ